ncbi:SRPBCC family protein [Segniliparus rugosus]|uniref:Polyketide cyclase / dehydrase and lipid transport n=1 Tax=Segniliparus rugosus (strain ATCC BAA-974 / DSM 45345 / CCUG 50838 / CIP 108380 / JCM 13579 / CDC 945) TaxID=679197 RepID=E5XR22_SEGRC|nr:SRPBCC family protein [Segniliparus rugosus]EFV13215.1 hypothetical protein HMPREF9336_01944 [Segniliparus rugosus ATCC BAA-974]
MPYAFFAKRRFQATEPVSAESYPEFVERAQYCVVSEAEYPYSVEQVWGAISGERMWSWLPTCWGPRYPAGGGAPGVVRDWQMYVFDWLYYSQHERILHWEPLRKIAYTVDNATLPFFGSWLEEYLIEPTADGKGTRLRWTWAMKIRFIGWLPLRWLAPILRPIFEFALRGVIREIEGGPMSAPKPTSA